MRTETCPYEEQVIAACRSGAWEDALLIHFRSCPRCGEADRVSEWLQNLSRLAHEAPLPDPDMLWIQSRISAQESAAQRAVRNLALRRALKLGLFGAIAVWLIQDWVKNERVTLGLWVLSIADVVEQAVRNPEWLVLVSIGVTLAGVGAVSALRPLLGRVGFLRFP